MENQEGDGLVCYPCYYGIETERECEAELERYYVLEYGTKVDNIEEQLT